MAARLEKKVFFVETARTAALSPSLAAADIGCNWWW